MSTSLREMYEKAGHVPYAELPWDSIEAARMRYDQDIIDKVPLDPIDARLADEHPIEGVSFSDQEAMFQQSKERNQKTRTFLEANKAYIQKRHEKYKAILARL